MSKSIFTLRRALCAGGASAVAVLLASCGGPRVPLTPPATSPAPESGEARPSSPSAAAPSTAHRSEASTPRAYRKDAATHLYGLNRERIWKGRLPPLLYAVGVLQVDVDGRGNVRDLHWMRAPRHAPEVIREIERTVRAASPFPAPVRMGKVVYTDTWLWDRSGRFQLDTLTEGQD